MQVQGERILILGDSLTHHGIDAAAPVWDVNAGSQRASSAPGDLLASLLLESGAEAVRTNAKVGRSALSFLGNEPAQQLIEADRTWRPSKVIVMLGTNDTQRDLAKTEAAMMQIRDAYRSMGAEVYAIGPMTYVGRGAVLNAPANNVFAAMQRVFGVDHIVDARPLTGDLQAERSADGIHFTSHSAPTLAARLLPEVKNTGSVLAAMKRRPLMSIGIGFGAVLLVGLIGIAIRRRNTVGGVGRVQLSPLSGYRVAYGTSAGNKTYRAFDPNTFSSIDSAMKHFRAYKRQGFWAWIEDEQGNFVPVQGAKMENVRKGYPLRSEDEVKQLVTGHLKPLKGLLAAPSELPPEITKKWKAAIKRYKKAIELLEGGDKDIDPAVKARNKLDKIIDEAAAYVPHTDPAIAELQAEKDALPKIGDASEAGRQARIAHYDAESKRLREEKREADRPFEWMKR